MHRPPANLLAGCSGAADRRCDSASITSQRHSRSDELVERNDLDRPVVAIDVDAFADR
jgi:hypothetical protein